MTQAGSSSSKRLSTGVAIMFVAAFVHWTAQAQTQQQRELCYGKNRVPAEPGRPELLIDDSTAIIESGRRSARDLAVALTDRGLGHRQTLEHQRAFEDFDQAIKLDPNYLPAYCERGYLYWEEGEFERARQDFERVIRLKRREADLDVEEF